jgi:hypothetical protein
MSTFLKLSGSTWANQGADILVSLHGGLYAPPLAVSVPSTFGTPEVLVGGQAGDVHGQVNCNGDCTFTLIDSLGSTCGVFECTVSTAPKRVHVPTGFALKVVPQGIGATVLSSFVEDSHRHRGVEMRIDTGPWLAIGVDEALMVPVGGELRFLTDCYVTI